jgi:hypothetical protein
VLPSLTAALPRAPQILERGELQVSDLERRSSAETLARDVVQVLVDKCVNPATGRPYTAGVLERALKDAHVALDPKRSAKQQALEALPRLQAQFPIERARMRFRIAAPAAAADALRAALAEQSASVELEELRNENVIGALLACSTGVAPDALTCFAAVTCTADPGSYRAFHAFTRSEACLGAGRLEVLSLAVAESGTLDGDDSLPLQHAPPAETQATRRETVDALADALAQAPLLAKPAARAGGDAAAPAATAAAAASAAVVVFPRAPIASLPEAHASRRERFAELDTLSPGWLVELRARPGSTVVDATLFAPDGTEFKSFADARRSALKARGAA